MIHGYGLLFDLMNIPCNTRDTTRVNRTGQSFEESPRQINGLIVAPRALVDNGTGFGNPVVRDRHRSATVRVGYDTVGKSQHKVMQTIIGGITEARVGSCGGSIVVCDIASAGCSLRASAVVASADLGGRAREHGS